MCRISFSMNCYSMSSKCLGPPPNRTLKLVHPVQPNTKHCVHMCYNKNYVFKKRILCVQNPTLMLLRTKPWLQIHPLQRHMAGSWQQSLWVPKWYFFTQYRYNSLINRNIAGNVSHTSTLLHFEHNDSVVEPASAQKTGLIHNVWYLVVRGVVPHFWCYGPFVDSKQP